MQTYEILIIVAACAFVLGVTIWKIVQKKRGKGGCDCGCGCGGNCAMCKSKPKEK